MLNFCGSTENNEQVVDLMWKMKPTSGNRRKNRQQWRITILSRFSKIANLTKEEFAKIDVDALTSSLTATEVGVVKDTKNLGDDFVISESNLLSIDKQTTVSNYGNDYNPDYDNSYDSNYNDRFGVSIIQTLITV